MNFLKSKAFSMKSGLLLFSLVPMFILMCIIAVFVSNNQLQKLFSQAENKFEKAVQEINVSMEHAINFSSNTIANHYIVNLFEKRYEDQDTNYQAFLTLDMFFTNYKEGTSSSQKSITVYHNNYTLYRSVFSQYIDSLEPSLLSKLKDLSITDMLWTSDNEYFYLYKTLTSGNFIFITEYSIHKSKVDISINKFDVLKNENQGLTNSIVLTDSPQEGSHIINKALANGQNISLHMPKKLTYNIYAKSFILYLSIFILFALLINLLSSLFTNRFKHKVTVFIDKIADNRKLVEIQNIPLHTNDVLAPVYNKIIQLIAKVNELHISNNQIKSEKNMIELKYVQSQLNPHLLYNTLGVLKWRCIKYNVPLSTVIDSIADYYRACISEHNEVILLLNEIDFIKKYISLMELIHARTYKTIIKIDDTLLHLKTIKHLLQPFVENAILHGIQQKPDGHIIIQGFYQDEFIVLKVTDNGSGITQERLNEIKQPNYFSKYKSYGIKNTKERIKLFYGDKANVIVKSKPNETTCITIKIPKVKINPLD